jgi:hypothetical protein
MNEPQQSSELEQKSIALHRRMYQKHIDRWTAKLQTLQGKCKHPSVMIRKGFDLAQDCPTKEMHCLDCGLFISEEVDYR